MAAENDIVQIIIFPEESTFSNGEIHLTEKLVKNGGEVWQFNRNDADPFPSKIHGHNKETGEVIDAFTGVIYKNRQQVRQLQKNQLYRLKNELIKAKFSL